MKFEFEPKKGLILVPVTIKGTVNTVNAVFVLDTGASLTVINNDVLLRAGYKKEDYIETENSTDFGLTLKISIFV